MAYYIDKDALVAEIGRRIESCAKQREDMLNVQCHTLADDASARMGELKCIQDFLDTLEVIEVQEEPVSEDLGESSNIYASENCEERMGEIDLKCAFKAGAQWQKEQMTGSVMEAYIDTQDKSVLYLDEPIKGNKVKLVIIKED